MSRFMVTLCVTAMLLAATSSGCIQGRQLVGTRSSECSLAFCPFCSKSDESFVETQPPLVDHSPDEHVSHVDEIAENTDSSRDLPFPEPRAKKTPAAVTKRVARTSRPARLSGVEEAAPIPPMPSRAVSSVDPKTVVRSDSPQPTETPELSATSRSTVKPASLSDGVSDPRPLQQARSDREPRTLVRSSDEAELDREFAQLRGQRDALKQSLAETSSATKAVGQKASSESIEKMLARLATQATQLTGRSASARSDGVSRRAPQTAADSDTQATAALSAMGTTGKPRGTTATATPMPGDLLGVGRRLFEQGRYRDAEQAFRGASQIAGTDQDRAMATYLLATSQNRQGRRSSAAETYRQVAQGTDATLAAMARWQLKQLEPNRNLR